MNKGFLIALLIIASLQTLTAQDHERFKSSKADTTHIPEVKDIVDSDNVVYAVNLVFQYGGESKLTLLPKVNLLRKHQLNLVSPYYGIELGVHPLFIAGAFTFSGVCGVEKGIFNLETSLSHYRTTRVKDGQDGYNGPYSQNLLNVKVGVQIMKVKLKLGTSFLLDEKIPRGQERVSLLDIGKINGTIYGIELQIRVK